MATVFNLPRAIKIQATGIPYPGALASFYAQGTLTLQTVYQDPALTVPHTNPVEADDDGYLPVIWLNPDALADYRLMLRSAAGVLLDDIDNIPRNPLTAGQVGQALFGRTPAEQAASVTPTSYAHPELFVSRYSATDTTALSQAITVAQQYAKATISIDRPLTLSSNLTIPATVRTEFVGLGKLTLAASVTFTHNGELPDYSHQIFDASASGAVVTGLIRTAYLRPEMWGARGDGVTDDATNIQKTIKAAVDANFIDVKFLNRTYKHNTTLYTGGDATGNIYHVALIPTDMDKSILDFSGIGAGLPGVMINSPTSGHVINKDVLKGMRLQGNATSIGVEFRGVCGAHVRGCSFYTNAEAIRWNNKTAGTFTEYNTAEDCYFATDNVLVGRYARDLGDSSFHGSGIGGRSVISSNSARTFIQIDSTCQPYNAMFDAQVFGTAGACTLFQNNSGLSVTFAGKLTWETGTQTLTLGAGNEVLFSGAMCGTGEFVTAGTFLQCQAVVLNTDNSTTALGGRQAYPSVAITTGANTFASKMAGQPRLVWITFRATNYDYRHLVWVEPDGTGGTTTAAITLATSRSLNTAAYGAPAFTINASGQLVATQAGWPASGVTALYAEQALSNGGIGAKSQRI